MSSRNRSSRAPAGRRRAGALVGALLLAACQSTATPPPSGPVPAVTDSPAPVEASTPPEPTVPPPPPPTTSAEKIVAAEQAGRIDHETALVDRVFALFGDRRLPADLRGTASEDVNALDEAHAALASLSPAAQASLRPYLVRPADPTSYWNQEPPATAGVELAVARVRGPAVGPAAPGAPACTDGWMHTRVSPNIPVMIWRECWGSPLDAQASMEEARGYMAALWGPETQLMGIPPGDRNVPDDGYEDTAETGDGLLDIYLLDNFTPTGNVRDLDVGANYGVTASAPPFDGPAGARTVAGYIVITPGLSGLLLESTLAHEFFHVLEYGKNREGLWQCPPTVANCNAAAPREFFWMTEASATWAEHYFVPAARATTDGPYDRFKVWRQGDLGLSRTEGDNEYASWLWPLFVQQQAGAPAVARIWESYRGKHGFDQLQAATSAVVPFDQQFREFGVRGWNELLNPGDPLGHHYFDASIDEKFPQDQPEGFHVEESIDLGVAGAGAHIEQLNIDSLAARYEPVSPSGEAHSIVFDFTALAPEIDVDAIVVLADGTWQRRKLDGQVTWCLDKPSDAVRQAYLVFSNHDPDPGLLMRNWSWEAKAEGCGTSEGTLTYSYLSTDPNGGIQGGSRSINATVQVHLKANDGSSGFPQDLLNDGSTYGVTTAWKTILPPGVDGCSPTQSGLGTPGGSLEPDSVTGGTWTDDAGNLRLGISADLPVHEEESDNYCSLGTGHSSNETRIQFGTDCDGTEAGSTGDTQRFVFDCRFQEGAVSWSITGTVILTR